MLSLWFVEAAHLASKFIHRTVSTMMNFSKGPIWNELEEMADFYYKLIINFFILDKTILILSYYVVIKIIFVKLIK
jgi:hypothetical protein